MVEKYIYSCDGGSLLVGNAGFAAHFPNEIGDGNWEVVVLSKDEQSPDYEHYTYRGSVEGMDINVYGYDCLHHLHDFTNANNILCTLRGKYHVYAKRGDTGDMLLHQRKAEQWDYGKE